MISRAMLRRSEIASDQQSSKSAADITGEKILFGAAFPRASSLAGSREFDRGPPVAPGLRRGNEGRGAVRQVHFHIASAGRRQLASAGRRTGRFLRPTLAFPVSQMAWVLRASTGQPTEGQTSYCRRRKQRPVVWFHPAGNTAYPEVTQHFGNHPHRVGDVDQQGLAGDEIRGEVVEWKAVRS